MITMKIIDSLHSADITQNLIKALRSLRGKLKSALERRIKHLSPQKKSPHLIRYAEHMKKCGLKSVHYADVDEFVKNYL